MGIEPRIQKRPNLTKMCARCHLSTSTDDFTFTHSIFYEDHLLPICNDCINNYLREHDYSWDSIDKLCQWADIPFIVKEYTALYLFIYRHSFLKSLVSVHNFPYLV